VGGNSEFGIPNSEFERVSGWAEIPNSSFLIPNLGERATIEPVTIDQTARLRTFIRTTLGCGCPDDVLNWIQCSHSDLAPQQEMRLTRIDVGGQLLVYVLEGGDDPQPAAEALRTVIAAGTIERNRGGFNRLRLVVATDDQDTFGPMMESSFAASAPRDDRVHLHVIAVSDLPFD